MSIIIVLIGILIIIGGVVGVMVWWLLIGENKHKLEELWRKFKARFTDFEPNQQPIIQQPVQQTPEQLQKDAELKQLQANYLNAQVNVKMIEVQRLRNSANIISQLSTWLIVGGIVGPCLCIVLLAMFSGNK